jgi:hypothetical protein
LNKYKHVKYKLRSFLTKKNQKMLRNYFKAIKQNQLIKGFKLFEKNLSTQSLYRAIFYVPGKNKTFLQLSIKYSFK